MDTLPGITDLDMLHFLFEIDLLALNELHSKGKAETEEGDRLVQNTELTRRLIYQMFKEGVYTLSHLQMKD